MSPPMSPPGMTPLPPAVLRTARRDGGNSSSSSDIDSPSPAARRLWRRSVDRPLGPSLFFGAAGTPSGTASAASGAVGGKEARALVSSPLLRVQSPPPACSLHSEAAPAPAPARGNRSLKAQMGQPPAPAITPITAATAAMATAAMATTGTGTPPASPLLLGTGVPDAARPGRIADEKRRADPALQSILATLAAMPASPVHAQLARLVDALLQASPAVLARTSLCRDTVTAIQALSQGPVARRILFVLAPLARAVVAQNIVNDQGSVSATAVTATTAAGGAAASASAIASTSVRSANGSSAVGASSCFASPVGTPRSGSPTSEASSGSNCHGSSSGCRLPARL